MWALCLAFNVYLNVFLSVLCALYVLCVEYYLLKRCGSGMMF